MGAQPKRPVIKFGFTPSEISNQQALLKTMRSYNPKVSMDPRVHYTTQSAAYERLIIGRKPPKERQKPGANTSGKRKVPREKKRSRVNILVGDLVKLLDGPISAT